jgi:hypothetical protein
VFISQAAIDRMKRGANAHENILKRLLVAGYNRGFLCVGFRDYGFIKFDLRSV